MKRSVVCLMLGLVLIAHGFAQAIDFPEEIPFVPTPIEVVDQMLRLTDIKQNDILYDLGSGDDRIVARAAKLYGIRAIGAEMDQLLLDKVVKLPGYELKIGGYKHQHILYLWRIGDGKNAR
jgi:hypothetical protein